MTELTAAPITDPAMPIFEASATLVAADLGNGNVVEQALFGRNGHGLADGMVFVHAVVQGRRRHDARARRVGVLSRHTGSSRCKSASFHAAIRVPIQCETRMSFARYHQVINSSPNRWDAVERSD